MARVSDLLTEARADLPSAPDFSIARALRRSAQRFFRESGVWRERITPITLVAGRTVYSLAAPAVGARIEWLISARFGEGEVGIATERDMHDASETATGAPRAIAVRSHTDEAVIWPAPGAAEDGKTIRLMAVIAPGSKTDTIPTPLLEEWGDGIVAGAKWEMMSMPAMPWTQFERAQDYERKFYEEVVRAKREATSGSQAPLRVKPVRFI